MSKIYIVMGSLFTCGDVIGPDIIEVFDSHEKAVKCIVNDPAWYRATYDKSNGEYSYEDRFGDKHIRFIEEYEVK